MAGMMVTDDGFYPYSPSLVTAYVFAFLFGISTMLHAYQMSYYRAWYMGNFVIGSLSQTVGFVCRCLSIYNTSSSELFLISTTLAFLPAIFYISTILALYIRIIKLVDAPHLSVLSITTLSILALIVDLLCFVTQTPGIVLKNLFSTSKIGSILLDIGLTLQLLFLLAFIGIAGHFYSKAIYDCFHLNLLPISGAKYTWVRLLHTILIAAILLLLRGTFKIIVSTAIIRQEVVFYTTDIIPMFVFQIGLSIVHPGMVLPSSPNGARELSLLDLYAVEDARQNQWKFGFAEKLRVMYHPAPKTVVKSKFDWKDVGSRTSKVWEKMRWWYPAKRRNVDQKTTAGDEGSSRAQQRQSVRRMGREISAPIPALPSRARSGYLQVVERDRQFDPTPMI